MNKQSSTSAKLLMFLLGFAFPASLIYGQVDVVSSGGIQIMSYTTLGDAFAAINAGTHTGTILIGISGDTTEGFNTPALLKGSGTGAASYTEIRIHPTGGARTISGIDSSGNPLIDLNGASNVTIDGLNSDGNSLTLFNTSTGTTVRFINDASNNTITRCSIRGLSTAQLGSAGGTIFFGAGVTTGNSNNTISLCDIGPGISHTPTKAICAIGGSVANSGNVIWNNNIFDFFDNAGTQSTAGIEIRSGNDNWTIGLNRLYQTTARTFTSGAPVYDGIRIQSNGAFTITSNVIGFGAADGTGATTISGVNNLMRGLDLIQTSTTTPTYVTGNVISGINQTTTVSSSNLLPFVGIALCLGSGRPDGSFDVDNGNTIGSLDGSSTIVFSSLNAFSTSIVGIYDFSSSSNTISNNNIGAIMIQGPGSSVGFRGIVADTLAGQTETIAYNVIGGTDVGGAIVDNQTGSYSFGGIRTIAPNVSITGNTISNMTWAGAVSSSNSGGIIVEGSTGSNTISYNTVQSLTNNPGTNGSTILGIYCSFAAAATANLVEGNIINSLSSTTSVPASSSIMAIMAASGNGAYQNNIIRLGLDAAGNSVTSGLAFVGLIDQSGVNNYYYNSVYIGGASVGTSTSTYAFLGNSSAGVRDVKDNIFWNARSRGPGASSNYAISLGTTSGRNSDFNDLLVTGTGGFVGALGPSKAATLADWRSLSGKDTNSISSDPQFADPTGAADSVDLHVGQASPVKGKGIPIAGIGFDFDGDTRDTTAPDIGADELGAAGAFLVVPNDSVSESASSITITVYRDNGSSGAVGVTYTTSNGSAVAPDDYASQSGTLTWDNGDDSPKTVTIPINEDDIYEGDEDFTVTLSAPTGGAVVAGSDTTTVTIVDDDPMPTFSINNVSQAEENSGTSLFVFTVTKNSAASVNTSIDFATSDYTATVADDDYNANSGTLTFAPDETTKMISVEVNGDQKIEPDEIFLLALMQSTETIGVGTILNDDSSPVAQDVSYSTEENTDQTIMLSASDTDGDVLAFSIVDGPTHGTLGSISDANCFTGSCSAAVVYTPENGYDGADSFTYKASDGSNESNVATASITVNPHVAPSVINTNDGGAGSLRQALADARDGDTISFNIPASSTTNSPAPTVITLTTGELAVSNNITLSGPGANLLVIARDTNAPPFRILHINSGHTVTIEGLTLSNGIADGTSPSDFGGAIYNDHSDLTVNGCVLSGNSAGNGGAIHNDGSIGGSATLTVTDSTLSGNSAIHGGGIHNSGSSSGTVTATINSSTLNGNSGSQSGGAIFNDGSNGNAGLTILSSTLSGNGDVGAIIANFGLNGIANTRISNSTLSENSVPIIANAGTVTIGNTILQAGSAGGNLANFFGSITSSGYNLTNDDGSGLLTAPGDQINTDPMLGQLKDNGGPTLTHAPLVNSPAIDQGKRDTIPALTTNFDQRGLARPTNDPAVADAASGDGSDVGAVEVGLGVHATNAASWKTHGTSGSFPIDLPFSGPVGIECRSGGANGNYQLIITFAQPVSFSSAEVTSGVGSVSGASAGVGNAGTSGAANTQVTINLTGVTNAQSLTVALFDVDDGTNHADVGVRMGVLLCDTTDDGTVNASDVSQVKMQSGQVVGADNFRADVIANGAINATDVSAAKGNSGKGMP